MSLGHHSDIIILVAIIIIIHLSVILIISNFKIMSTFLNTVNLSIKHQLPFIIIIFIGRYFTFPTITFPTSYFPDNHFTDSYMYFGWRLITIIHELHEMIVGEMIVGEMNCR